MQLDELLAITREEFPSTLKKHLYTITLVGSGAREIDYFPRWSDLDIVIVPDYEFLCPRGCYEKIALWYTNIRERVEDVGRMWGLDEQVNLHVYDVGTVKSTRLTRMTEGFRKHILRSGENYLERGRDIKEILPRKISQTREENDIGYAAWRTRITATELNYQRKRDENTLKYNIKMSLRGLTNFRRRVVEYIDHELVYDANPRIADRFIELFPEVNQRDFSEIIQLSSRWPNHKRIDLDELTDLFFKGLEIREAVIKTLVNES